MFSRKVVTIRPLGYNETPMLGHYTTVLRKISRSYSVTRRTPLMYRHLSSKKEEDNEHNSSSSSTWQFCNFSLPSRCQRTLGNVKNAWLVIFDRFGGEWLLLTSLGIVVAIFSFIMDIIMEKCTIGRMMMLEALSFSVPLQYFVCIFFSMALVCFAVGFTHIVGPAAIGSGIPEVKTIMRGVPIAGCLTFRTLMAKVVGLSTALGSGIPIGKEGPFVHVASISASLLSKLFSCFRRQKNESKEIDILTAACAVGVACTFAAPIGGVLFSIEVTATYFAVKNYWRAFYSALVGAIFFRFLAIWFQEEVTLTAYFRTDLARDTLFVPGEILPFAFIGIVCGFGGVLFIQSHKRIVLFIRNNKKCKSIIQKNRFIYPCIVTFVVMSLFFPPGFGQYMGGMLTNPDAVRQFFNNNTWSNEHTDSTTTTSEDDALIRSWRGPLNNVYVSLVFFFIVRFCACALATTLPIPAGIFIPSFTLGACVGRFFGEVLALWFPDGIGGNAVLPGGYAIVGAAAFAGSVTHTVSTVVIAFEMSGQIGYVPPCIVAVLIACVISEKITKSLFDVILEIKKLPFLPSSVKTTGNMQSLRAKEFMIRDVEYLTETTTYREVDDMLTRHTYKTFPLIESAENRLLLGSIHRFDLERLLNRKVSLLIKTDDHFNRKRKISTKNEASLPDTDSGVNQKTTIAEANAREEMKLEVVKEEEEETENDEYGWLDRLLNEVIDLRECPIDPAPFQLVDKTPLLKVHSVFSLLGLQHAFVTKTGKLVGIISVKEVQYALENETTAAASRGARKTMKYFGYSRS